MGQPRILAFAGSLRKDSYNKKLAIVSAEAATAAGAHVTLIDLRDYQLPLYDGDLEAASGHPPASHALKQLFYDHQGLLLACPEYNSSMTGVFKNTIDWVSRPLPGEVANIAFQNKLVTLLSTAPGALGGLRGLVHVRSMLSNIGAIVLPGQLAIPKSPEAFTASGKLADSRQQASVEKLAANLAGMIERFHR
ncbi:MAG TPA: NAD(P)H-dependent oxidoreductase [Bryobacteraceae bacterium]|nr:NAD(P)H-dependent oxidoreductase [Bryobacteraceae bacterium]